MLCYFPSTRRAKWLLVSCGNSKYVLCVACVCWWWVGDWWVVGYSVLEIGCFIFLCSQFNSQWWLFMLCCCSRELYNYYMYHLGFVTLLLASYLAFCLILIPKHPYQNLHKPVKWAFVYLIFQSCNCCFVLLFILSST